MVTTVSVAHRLGQELCHGGSALTPAGDAHCDAHLRDCHGKLNGLKFRASPGVEKRLQFLERGLQRRPAPRQRSATAVHAVQRPAYAVAEHRLQRAYAMLTDPTYADMRIIDIALTAGFGDVSHFNRMFRRRFGDSPSGVRASGPHRQPG